MSTEPGTARNDRKGAKNSRTTVWEIHPVMKLTAQPSLVSHPQRRRGRRITPDPRNGISPQRQVTLVGDTGQSRTSARPFSHAEPF
jgi:hypothetical protein